VPDTQVRAQKIDELDVFLNTPRDLRLMFERFAKDAVQVDDPMSKRNVRKQAAMPTPVNDRDCGSE
jgi:ribosomal protein L29